MDRKKIVKHLLALVVLALLTFAAEVFIFQGHAVFGHSYISQYFARGEGGKRFLRVEKDDEIIYSVEAGGEYINRLLMEYESDSDIPYQVVLMKKGSKGEERKIATLEDTAFGKFHEAVTVVNRKADRVVVRIDKEDLQEDAQLLVSSICLSNQVYRNVYRMAFVFISLCIAYVVLVMRHKMAGHLEHVFFLMAMLMGIMMIVLRPDAFLSWDEETHFNRAYSMTFRGSVEYTQGTYALYGRQQLSRLTPTSISTMNSIEERKAAAGYLQDNNNKIAVVNEKRTDFVDYRHRAYLPQALGIQLGKTMGLPLRQTLWLGKFFNLLLYVSVMAAAIKYAKVGRLMLLCVGLLPTSLYLATVFSYDAFVTAFLMFGFVMVLNELTDGQAGLNWKRITAGVLAILLGSFSKAVYVPMLLPLCFLPKEKFVSRRQRICFILAILLIFAIMMGSFVLPVLSGLVGHVEVAGDSRGGDTSVSGQLMHIMADPLAYAQLLLENMAGTMGPYFLGAGSRLSFAYMGAEAGNAYYVNVVGTVLAVMAGKNEEVLGRKLKVVIGTMLVGVAVLIWTALYLDFTPVGADVINGVQPRYYIPLMYPAMLLLSNDRFKFRGDWDRLHTGVVLAQLFVLCSCIYHLILLPYCS